jgi:hypothetical protein
VIGYFLAFSLFPEKHERYLMPLVPGLALWVGYVYHRVWSSDALPGRETSVIQIMLGVMSVAFIGFVSIGPYLIQKKWSIPTDVFPVIYQGIVVLFAGALIYFLYRSQIRIALNIVGILAVGFMMGLVLFIVPGIDSVASPKVMFTEIRSFLKNPTDYIYALQHWRWRSDEDVFYWQHVHRGALRIGWGVEDAESLQVLKDKVKKKGQLVILMTENQYHQSVSRDPELKVVVLREFFRPKIKILLVSVELNN